MPCVKGVLTSSFIRCAFSPPFISALVLISCCLFLCHRSPLGFSLSGRDAWRRVLYCLLVSTGEKTSAELHCIYRRQVADCLPSRPFSLILQFGVMNCASLVCSQKKTTTRDLFCLFCQILIHPFREVSKLLRRPHHCDEVKQWIHLSPVFHTHTHPYSFHLSPLCFRPSHDWTTLSAPKNQPAATVSISLLSSVFPPLLLPSTPLSLRFTSHIPPTTAPYPPSAGLPFQYPQKSQTVVLFFLFALLPLSLKYGIFMSPRVLFFLIYLLLFSAQLD